MKKKILGGIAIFIILILAGGYGLYSHFMNRSVPVVSGELILDGLAQKVSVYRDEKGIPHIDAQNELDLYRAYGFIHASERLFQLDLYRRASRGQLSEIFGELGLEKDRLTRTLHLDSPLDHPARVPLSAEARKRTNAYLAGLNSFIDSGKLPMEFILLRYKPSHFELRDVYAFIGYMAYLFANAPKQDALFENLKKVYDEDSLSLMGNDVSLSKKKAMSSFPTNLEPLYDESLFYLPPVDGSNAWVLSGNRTQNGKPILANDLHVGISLPGLWFEAHLKAPGFEVYGHYLPLVPFAALGHDSRRSWGMTISNVDDMDFFKESVDWNLNKVSYKGDLVALKKREHTIKIKNKPTETFVSWDGPHGPLLGKASVKEFSKPEFALQWTYHHKDNRPLEAFYSLNYAKSFEEMRLAMTLGTAPGLNFLYADTAGNIAWWIYGAIPLRPKGMQGDRIYPGETGEYDWLGHVPMDKKPQMENPPSGIIVSANARPPGASKHVKGYWQSQDRAQTIFELLSKKERWSTQEILKLQTSNMNTKAISFKQRLRQDLTLEPFKGKLEREAALILEKWDGASELDSIGATIYHLTTTKLLKNLFDELSSQDFLKYCHLNASWRALYRLSKLPEHKLWDLKATKETEKMHQSVRKSFREAVSELAQKFGPQTKNWKWGSLHQIEFRHPLGSKGGLLKKIFNLGPYPVAGSFNSINHFRRLGCKHEYSVRAGPSTRIVVDLQDTLSSFGGLPLGTSGHHRSPYFSNERKDFLNGIHRKQIMDWKKIVNYSSLSLIPSP